MRPTGKKPYFTAKAVAALLAGDNQCHAALWIKSRYWTQKRPSDFNFAEWQRQHGELVSKRKAELEAEGWTVSIENENKFELEGVHARISGKPDLVAVKRWKPWRPQPNQVLVSDAKTGQQRGTDLHQVLVYMACLPLDDADRFGNTELSGEVVYSGGVAEVPASELTVERKAAIWAKLRELSREQAFPTTPSANECSFCDIAECSDRIVEKPATPVSEF